jgi:putative ABC transport system permease protein
MFLELIRRLWFLLNQNRFERSLEDEMEFHREMMQRAGRDGFGNTLRLREEARDAWGWAWVDHLWGDFKHGVRVLLKSPAFTIAAVTVLCLGIGGATAMFSIIYSALLKPLPFDDPARLVFGRATLNGELNPVVSAPDYYDYREQADRLEGLSAVFAAAQRATVTGGVEPQRVAWTFVEHDLFRTLGVAPSIGRWFTPEEGQAGGPPAVLISGGFAQRWFGTAGNAVGASLALDGRTYTVVGVMPGAFRFLYDVDVWIPMHRGEGLAGMPRQFHNWLTVGRLKPGISLESAQHQVDVISKRLEQQYPASNRNKALRLDPLQSALSGRLAPRLLVLMGAISLVLLIACANVAGLMLARSSARRPELAMRAALGASRVRIAAQLLVENITLALLSGVLGIALAFWLDRLLPPVIGLSPGAAGHGSLSGPVLLYALALSVFTGFLCGVGPALRASSHLLAQGFAPSPRTTGTKAGASLRDALVVGQVAVSVVLLVGAGLLIRSFVHLSGTHPGFETQNLLTGEIQAPEVQNADYGRPIRFFEALREDLAAVPGVEAVGFVSSLPILNPSFNLSVWEAGNRPANPETVGMAHRRVVLPGYFDAIRIPLRSGRDFGRGDRYGTPLTMIINERMARTLFPNRNPLGQRVSVDMFGKQPAFEVVGVVGDARLDFVGDDPPMTMYLSYCQFPDPTMRFAVRTGREPEALTQTVRRLVLARDPTVAVENLVSMERIVGESLAPQQATATLLALLAAIAVLLAAIGLYGVLAYSVSRRTREIGVRMAMGARSIDILRLVMGRGVALAFAGVVVGLAAAAALTHLLNGLLFEVPSTDPLTFSAAPLCLLGVAVLATYLPARRAAKVHPLRALRLD